MSDEREYYGRCNHEGTLHEESLHCIDWVPDLNEPVVGVAATGETPQQPAQDKCPTCSSDKQAIRKITKPYHEEGEWMYPECNDPWHSGALSEPPSAMSPTWYKDLKDFVAEMEHAPRSVCYDSDGQTERDPDRCQKCYLEQIIADIPQPWAESVLARVPRKEEKP